MGELPKFNGEEMLKGMESEHQEAFEKNKKIIEANTKKNGELTQEIIDNLKGKEDSRENNPLDDKLEGLTGAIETLQTMERKGDQGLEAAKQNVIKGAGNLRSEISQDPEVIKAKEARLQEQLTEQINQIFEEAEKKQEKEK
jgi:hypothetical protein